MPSQLLGHALMRSSWSCCSELWATRARGAVVQQAERRCSRLQLRTREHQRQGSRMCSHSPGEQQLVLGLADGV